MGFVVIHPDLSPDAGAKVEESWATLRKQATVELDMHKTANTTRQQDVRDGEKKGVSKIIVALSHENGFLKSCHRKLVTYLTRY